MACDQGLTAVSQFDLNSQVRRIKTLMITYLMVGYVFLVSRALSPMGCAKACESCSLYMVEEQSIEVRRSQIAHRTCLPLIQ